MLEVPIYNTAGEKIDTMKVDEDVFGAEVNVPLVKQAVVMYEANRHQGSASNKGRSDKAGSTRKIFRQKGTGYARRGNIRTNIMRGGGVTFAKSPIRPRKSMPKKMRRAALRSAILAKILGGDLLVIDGMKLDAPKTVEMASIMTNLKINRSCLLTLAEHDSNVYLSSRNLPDITVRTAAELNAYDIAVRQRMLVTTEAMQLLCGREVKA